MFYSISYRNKLCLQKSSSTLQWCETFRDAWLFPLNVEPLQPGHPAAKTLASCEHDGAHKSQELLKLQHGFDGLFSQKYLYHGLLSYRHGRELVKWSVLYNIANWPQELPILDYSGFCSAFLPVPLASKYNDNDIFHFNILQVGLVLNELEGH